MGRKLRALAAVGLWLGLATAAAERLQIARTGIRRNVSRVLLALVLLATPVPTLALLVGVGSAPASEITLIQYDLGSAPEVGRWDTAWASLELAPCGNGLVEGSEECDDGNTEPSDCCSPTCQYESAATVCRQAAGVCDAPDNCDGAGTCTADAKLTVECRAAASACDAEEFCDGVSPDCPPDLFLPAGTVCRASAGVCDPAWFCDGVSHDCDPLIFPLPIVCRASTGVCDPEEVCDGLGCPPDMIFPPGTVCRASSGLCDIAEVCDESAMCPADAYEPPTSECRASAGGCDIAENCTGLTVDCPADASITACIDDDSCCPEGCSAEDDNDCLEIPAQPAPALPPWMLGLLAALLLLAVGLVAARLRASRHEAA